ncbi:uncharacterized protein BDW47DRAFT_130774 [Aspergillus candidus]|uniref:BTB domain-containing protein n=1 Tax=Aspergillus candidus TaxID=41067 RepID=A0A2I2FG51_ASPCN|nr:hypothetical protein BDW47DRAFT_130774 [Aspergillus candidus]PLB39589.1 hypothetical protein BDW47DRAFT_130774 [Aspergillus candidus]
MGSTYSSPHDSNHELNPGPEQLRVRVSSKPLALASSYFGRLLANSRTVLLPDVWEEFRGDITQPLLLILRAIHGQNRKVPRSLGFQMMYKVAFLADYFGCSEAVEIFADTWIRNAEGLLPKSYTVDVPRWLCIAWVLRHHDLFTAVTCLAIHTIAKTREEYMEEILTSVFDYVDTLSLDDSTTCCPDCASLILGLLLRQLTSLKLYPQPLPPYFTHNVDELLKSLPTLEPPRCSAHVHKLNGCHGRCAVLLPRTGEVLQKIEAKMKGLDLADYVDIDWVPHAA